jgi:hypothetical protein
MSGVADWPPLPDLAISNHHQLEIAVTFSSEKRPRQISLMLKVLADGYIQNSHVPWRLLSLKKNRRMPPKRTTGGGAGEPGTSDPLTPGGAGPCRPGAPQTLLVLSEMQTCSSMSGEAGGRIKRASALNRPFSASWGREGSAESPGASIDRTQESHLLVRDGAGSSSDAVGTHA